MTEAACSSNPEGSQPLAGVLNAAIPPEMMRYNYSSNPKGSQPFAGALSAAIPPQSKKNAAPFLEPGGFAAISRGVERSDTPGNDAL